ncbi:MAG: hypothetical protein U9Q24_03190 [Candidatus Ratteibacteria bacterium]|nr:hypothetical protein [Candidatus Ratteibacteria bacterium]
MFKLRKREAVIFSFFILLSLIITYPLIFKMNNSIFSDSEWTFDSLGYIHGLWMEKYTLLNNTDDEKNDMTAYPFGVPYESSRLKRYTSPFALLMLLVILKNEIFAYNVYMLTSFILAGIFIYYLCFYVTRNRTASLVSSIIFAFSPNHFLQAFSHIGMAQIQWMPLYILSLIMLYEKRTYLSAIFCGLSFSLVVLMNYYFGYFMVILTAGFILFNLTRKVWGEMDLAGKTERLKTLKLVLLAGLTALVMILPSTYDTLRNIIRPQKIEAGVSAIYKRSYEDLYKYAGRGYDYLLPSEYHPLFGKLTKKIVKKITGGQRHWAERTLFLGITPLFLAVVALTGWKKRRKLKIRGNREDFYIPLFLFLAVFCFYTSLSPVIKFWKIKIPTLSFFLYHLAPMFRVYARMGFVVTLCLAVLAGFGLRDILGKLKKKWKQVTVTAVFSALILFEYTVIPPFRNVDFSKTPAVYEWLAEQPKEVVIVEYPLYAAIDERHFNYLFYQRIHRKKMINGAPRGSKGYAIREVMMDILKPQSRSVLSSLGADYLIIHKEIYDQKAIFKLDSSKDLEFLGDFPEARVYRIKESTTEKEIKPQMDTGEHRRKINKKRKLTTEDTEKNKKKEIKITTDKHEK